MDEYTKRWIKAVLANDEVATDNELIELFVNEGGLTPEDARQWTRLRDQYLRDPLCNAEPGAKETQSPYVFPTFQGYTVDNRLREFRKAELGKP